MKKRVVLIKIYKDGTILDFLHGWDDLEQAREGADYLNAQEEFTRDGLWYAVEEDE